MITSRGITLGRIVHNVFLKSNFRSTNIEAVRNSGHIVSYRQPPPPASKATRIGAELVGAAMWWWILWHLWHEHEHITGEWEYPDPSSWTNVELGIPPDDYEE